MALVDSTEVFSEWNSHVLVIKTKTTFHRSLLTLSSKYKNDKYSPRARDFSSGSRHFQIHFLLAD
jgi:hypothetical protein